MAFLIQRLKSKVVNPILSFKIHILKIKNLSKIGLFIRIINFRPYYISEFFE